MSKSTAYKTDQAYRFHAEVVPKISSGDKVQLCNQGKVDTEDLLKFCILTSLHWMRRLFNSGDVPEELKCAKTESRSKVKLNSFLSFSVDRSRFHIDVQSATEKGIWAARVTESTVALSKNGRHGVERIVNNIGFRILDGIVHFAMTIDRCRPQWYDDGLLYPADPPHIVKMLATMDKSIGLKQVDLLDRGCGVITNKSELKQFIDIHNDALNSLPSCVFLGSAEQLGVKSPTNDISNLPSPEMFSSASCVMFTRRDAVLANHMDNYVRDQAKDVALAIAFGKRLIGMCRSYYIKPDMVNTACARLKIKANPGDMIYLLGKSATVYRFKDKSVRSFWNVINSDNAIMRDCMMLAENKPIAPVLMVGSIFTAVQDNHEDDIALWKNRYEKAQASMKQQEDEWKRKLSIVQEENERLSAQVERGKAYQESIERDKISLQAELRASHEALENKEKADQEEIDYLRRSIARPQTHSEITEWAKKMFDKRLLIHSRAADMLTQKSAREIDFSLICDALDFLATDYWDSVFGDLSDDQLLTNCATKYGRPFEVVPVTEHTIESLPSQYKVKYIMAGDKRRKEVPLKLHLRVGRTPSDLLRVYFFLDKERQLIVVGSLPHHLETITINC